MRSRALAGVLAVVTTASVSGGAAAQPAAGVRQTVTASFTTTTPGAPTGLTVSAVYSSGGPGPPHALVHVDDGAPAGTTIANASVPQCRANDLNLIIRGAAACPAGSIVGSGSVILDLGLPGGLGRVTTDVTLINAPGQILFLGREPHTGIALVDHGIIEGSTISIAIPRLPGLDPGGAVLDSEQFTITQSSGLLRAPARCPPGGWLVHRTHTYSDGVTQVATVALPCQRGRRRGHARLTRSR